MAAVLWLLLFLFAFSDSLCTIKSLRVGVNYRPSTNTSFPSPTRVSSALRSLNGTRVKIFYNEDPNVLSAFANTQIELIIELGNEYIPRMGDPTEARKWIKQHIQPCIPQTKIKGIAIGKEVLEAYYSNKTNPTGFDLLRAMKTINGALRNLGLNKEIFVTTAYSFEMIEYKNESSTSPPAFRTDYIEDIRNILEFHQQTKSPFLIRAYTYHSYAFAEAWSLKYSVSQPNPGMIEPATNLHYDNFLYQLIDLAYLAIESLGYTNIRVMVSETGWPFKGDTAEEWASPENAGLFVGELFHRMQMNQGTPARPDVPVEVFVSSLFNEVVAAPGGIPSWNSDLNFALYHPDGIPAFRLGLRGYLPRMDMDSSASHKSVRRD